MSDVIQFTRKSVVFEKAGIKSINVFIPLQKTIDLYGGLISRLFATYVICSVFMSVLFK